MADVELIEQEAQLLVESVRDRYIAQLSDVLSGDSKTIDGKAMYEHFAKAGLTDAQLQVVRHAMIQSCDMVIAMMLAFLEYEISSGRLRMTIVNQDYSESVGEVDGTDMLAANYFGHDGWVERYSQQK